MRKLARVGVMGGAMGVMAYLWVIRPWHLRWGATEDELIDFMDWLIDHKLPSEHLDMSKVEVTEEPLERFSEEVLGPMTGEGTLNGEDGEANCRWWSGALYVVDFGDVRLMFRPT